MFDLAKDFDCIRLFGLSGFTIYEIEGAFGCVHLDDEKSHQRAIELGAKVVGFGKLMESRKL